MTMLERAMRKVAYVPLTPAAQEAVQQQMPPQGAPMPADPSMMGGQPPMDPAMMQGAPMPSQGMPPMHPEQMPPQGAAPQGAMPPIQIVPGPNGEQVDAETGFVVLDAQQGIEQDPLTGILFNKALMEFATPDGQPLPPEQAIAMIEQARQGGMPQQGQAPMPPTAQPPMDPAMMQGAPVSPAAAPMPPAQSMMQQMAAADPAMMGQAPMMDPAAMGVAPVQVVEDPATGMPVDAATGMPIDPNTGMPVDPSTGAPVPGAATAPGMGNPNDIFAAMPELQELVKTAPKQLEAQDKTMTRVQQDVNAARTDIQGLRREIQKANDNSNTMLERMNNLLAITEQLIQEVSSAPSPAVPVAPVAGV